jgi:hypothetical protein
MADNFSTNFMLGVIEDLKVSGNSLLQTFFPSIVTETSEEIHFDVDDARRRVAPFVSPLVPGRVVQGRGQKTSTFKPAYVKDKRVFDPSRALKRAMGETIGGGQYSPEQRMEMLVVQELNDQLNMLRRRQELMALEALSTGTVTVAGDDYPSVTVDFGRAAALSVTALTSTARWGQSAADPLANLMAWALLVQQSSGVLPRKVILDPETAAAMLKNADVQKEIDYRWVDNARLAIDLSDNEGLQPIGKIRGFELWVYTGWYVDPADDTEKRILTAGRVIMASSAVDGIQAFGAIKDHDSLQAVPYFPKSWKQDDPSVRFLMLQSAPLVVPTRPNATLGVNVL